MSLGSQVPAYPNGRSQNHVDYESIEFTLTNGQTDYDLDANQATYKEVITGEANYVEIYSTETISIKFNATANHAITIEADTLRVFDRQIFKNIYLTNSSGSNSTVRLYIK